VQTKSIVHGWRVRFETCPEYFRQSGITDLLSYEETEVPKLRVHLTQRRALTMQTEAPETSVASPVSRAVQL
jgi:hypothetical protein